MNERMMDKTCQPTYEDMVAWIGESLSIEWSTLRHFIEVTYHILPIFNSGGKKYGWNLQYRISGKPLCEMYPEHGSFTVLVILGKAEMEKAIARLESFGSLIQKSLTETPRFHDGCWMYIRVSDPESSHEDVLDIFELVLIKRKPPKFKSQLAN